MLSPCVSCAFQLILERPRRPQARSRDPPPGRSDLRQGDAEGRALGPAGARSLAFMRARPRGRACARAPASPEVRVRVRIARWALGTAAARTAPGAGSAARPSSAFALQRSIGSGAGAESGVEDPGLLSVPLSTPSPGVWGGSGSWPLSLVPGLPSPLTFAVAEILFLSVLRIRKVLSPLLRRLRPEMCFTPLIPEALNVIWC